MKGKKTIKLSLIVVLCGVAFSCAHQSKMDNPSFREYFENTYSFNYSDSLGRVPAAAPNCTNNMKYILLKRNRSKSMAEMIKAQDLDGIKGMFWDSHDAERQQSKIPYSAWYRKLRRLNKSNHVPAFFQTENKITGDVDTFSTIIKVVDDDVSFNAQEKEALEDVLGWVDHVNDYHARFDQVVEYGFEVRSTLNRLKDYLNNDRKMTRSSFPRDVSVPVVNKDGEVIESEIHFETIDDLKDYINDKEKEVVLTFSQNIFDEYFKKSRIYDVMIDQAVYFRRLELVQERLNNIPVAKLSDDQMALKEIIKEVMDNPLTHPRMDAAQYIRKREKAAEFWATLRFWKSKRVEKQAKYTIPTEVLKQAKAVSPYGVMIRSMALVTVVTTPLTIIYNDNPWVQYVSNSITNKINDFIVFTLGMPSSPLSACYKTERQWSIEEGSTMNSFLESHLSRFTTYQRIDPTYDPDKDPEYIKKKVELQSMCLKMRLDYKAADRHKANKDLLDEHGYRFAAHMVLMDLVDQQYDDEELSEALYAYFEENEVFEDEEAAQKKLDFIRTRTSEEFVTQIQQYQQDVKALTPRIQNGEFDVYYPSTDEFFDSIDKYREQSE